MNTLFPGVVVALVGWKVRLTSTTFPKTREIRTVAWAMISHELGRVVSQNDTTKQVIKPGFFI